MRALLRSSWYYVEQCSLVDIGGGLQCITVALVHCQIELVVVTTDYVWSFYKCVLEGEVRSKIGLCITHYQSPPPLPVPFHY